jgi:hypothetical protein
MASPTNGGDAADQAVAQPNFKVITQYIKDFRSRIRMRRSP